MIKCMAMLFVLIHTVSGTCEDLFVGGSSGSNKLSCDITSNDKDSYSIDDSTIDMNTFKTFSGTKLTLTIRPNMSANIIKLNFTSRSTFIINNGDGVTSELSSNFPFTVEVNNTDVIGVGNFKKIKVFGKHLTVSPLDNTHKITEIVTDTDLTFTSPALVNFIDYQPMPTYNPVSVKDDKPINLFSQGVTGVGTIKTYGDIKFKGFNATTMVLSDGDHYIFDINGEDSSIGTIYNSVSKNSITVSTNIIPSFCMVTNTNNNMTMTFTDINPLHTLYVNFIAYESNTITITKEEGTVRLESSMSAESITVISVLLSLGVSGYFFNSTIGGVTFVVGTITLAFYFMWKKKR